jgi:hypothetical protein
MDIRGSTVARKRPESAAIAALKVATVNERVGR